MQLGGIGANGSGDIFIAFSTANKEAYIQKGKTEVATPSNNWMNDILATIDATEEAVINSMVAAETMEGINGNKVYAIPHEKLRS